MEKKLKDNKYQKTKAGIKINSGKTALPYKKSESGKIDLKPFIKFIKTSDHELLKKSLDKYYLELDKFNFMSKLIIPLLNIIGDYWQEEKLKVWHEHFASVVIQGYLDTINKSYKFNKNSPALLVSTLSGEIHEFGATIVANIAKSIGWKVINFGINLPAEEIIEIILNNNVNVFCLSMINYQKENNFKSQLKKIISNIPNQVEIIVGGRSVKFYEKILQGKNVSIIQDLKLLKSKLKSLLLQSGMTSKSLEITKTKRKYHKKVIENSDVVIINGKKIYLTEMENKIIEYLFKSSEPVSSKKLIFHLTGYEGNTEVIRTHIKNIRAKIENDKYNPEFILYFHQKGYFINKKKFKLS